MLQLIIAECGAHSRKHVRTSTRVMCIQDTNDAIRHQSRLLDSVEKARMVIEELLTEGRLIQDHVGGLGWAHSIYHTTSMDDFQSVECTSSTMIAPSLATLYDIYLYCAKSCIIVHIATTWRARL